MSLKLAILYFLLAVQWCCAHNSIESSAKISSSSPSKRLAYFYSVLEKSLLNDSVTLYQLQQVFFPTNNHLNAAKVPFRVSITVESVTNSSTTIEFGEDTVFNCSSTSGMCVWSNIHIDWYPEVNADLYSDDLRQYVLSVQDKLRELEFVSWSVLQLLARVSAREDHPAVDLVFTVSTLNALPSNEDASQALLSIMAWVSHFGIIILA